MSQSRDNLALSRSHYSQKSSLRSLPSLVLAVEQQSGGGNEHQINETIRPFVGTYHSTYQRGNTLVEDQTPKNENMIPPQMKRKNG